MKRIWLPLALGLFVSLTACAPKDAPTTSPSQTPPTPTVTAPVVTPTPPPVPTPTVSAVPAPEWGELEEAFAQTHPDKPEVVLVKGYFSLPHIENAAGVSAYESFNRYYERLLEDLKNDLKADIAQALDDYNTITALGGTFASHSVEQSFEVVYHTERTVGVLRTYYGFSDSPYPTLLYMADRFDMERGVNLSFVDFFTDEAKAEELVRGEVVRQAAAYEQYDQATVALAFNWEYFYPTADGLVFFYQPQTLNPQAATMPEFLVSYDLLEGLLKR